MARTARRGGVVFIRAGSVAGTGIIDANGGDQRSVGLGLFGDGGGGGAGGSLYVRLTGPISPSICAGLQVAGANGGDTPSSLRATGGGGGGGYLSLTTTTACQPLDGVSGGAAGNGGSFSAIGSPGVENIVLLNDAPIANAGADQTIIGCPACLTSVLLNGSGSSDPRRRSAHVSLGRRGDDARDHRGPDEGGDGCSRIRRAHDSAHRD